MSAVVPDSPVSGIDTNPVDIVDDDCDRTNFIYKIVESDVAEGRIKKVITRFPPEPNGFLHIGHAKSICLNFELAKAFGGRTHLRFDDTNPTTEDIIYIDSIKKDVQWLGYDWGEHLYFASDYFQQLYEWAVLLIKKGLAYVDDQSVEEIRETRGSITEPGKESPYRNRSIEENLDLFEKMRAGEFPDGYCSLRAKIDMASGNMNMRDPILYRIIRATHVNTGDQWIIYPMYDYAHGQCDSLENISHSICTVEFENHRPLYDWFQEKLEIPPTRQIEYARLNLTYCVMNKRLLIQLVKRGLVRGWDDPRMPTISGLRRRGCPAAAIRRFCRKVGVAKRENLIQIELLEDCMREVMNENAVRLFAVIDPLLVEIENLPEDFEEVVEVDGAEGNRRLTFGKRFYVDRKDFMEEPSTGFHRLFVGNEVRLRHCYWIKCINFVKNNDKVEKLICTYDPSTKGGAAPPDGRKVKATIHWLNEKDSKPAEIRWYSRLFTKPDPKEGVVEKDDWIKNFNQNSMHIYEHSLCERAAADLEVGEPIHFERHGYFTKDPDSTDSHTVFNLTVGIPDKFEVDSMKKEHKERERQRRLEAAARRMKHAS
ncbi:putative glutamine--tRNA ligase [Babesia bovis T2Bo]|uniref:glutamine--tRNA ligase n=1 Tax=Babesia bovis TaxID=5865 RepID=A7ANR7_BABBO|nr:putative glutamine--tRNA ligase [Babesia bovis T2Bo]EDO08201.1 putative glutamine--tRNA ligase [Babesia bovis T2Bo]|eukprot:XP_001611769.1 glutaminyl-tRNA synthetase family protein [Babesia bovis T2Bo]